MNRDDLTLIESRLGLKLPEEYQRVMLDYPFGTLRGNDDSELFDEPTMIIVRNTECRKGGPGSKRWPASLLFIGHDGAGGFHALDLSANPARVLLLDQGNSERATVLADSLDEWIAHLRKELVPWEVNPSNTPRRERIMAWILIGILGLLLLIAGAVKMIGQLGNSKP